MGIYIYWVLISLCDELLVSSDNINFDVSTVGLAKIEVFVDGRISVGDIFRHPIVGGMYGATLSSL